MLLKEDIQQSKERLKAWWDHEIIDRPCIGYNYPKREAKISSIGEITDYFFPFCLAERPDDIAGCFMKFEELAQQLHFGGENLPNFRPNFGAGCLAAIFGLEPELKKGDNKYGIFSKTVWYKGNIKPDELIPFLEKVEINRNNIWYDRYLKSIEYAAKRANGQFTVAMIDISGMFDLLSFFMGPEKIILTMKRNPSIIETVSSILLEKMWKAYQELQSIVERYSGGSNSWLNLWCPKRYYPIQSDFSAILNPKWFEAFVFPLLKTQSQRLEYAIYHLDGINQLNHLDKILNIETIHGIQWVPGAEKEITSNLHWMYLYKKIQAAGKSLILSSFEDPTYLDHFYKELNPKLLYISSFYLDPLRAEFYLPEFVNGQGGKGDFLKFKRSKKKELKRNR